MPSFTVFAVGYDEHARGDWTAAQVVEQFEQTDSAISHALLGAEAALRELHEAIERFERGREGAEKCGSDAKPLGLSPFVSLEQHQEEWKRQIRNRVTARPKMELLAPAVQEAQLLAAQAVSQVLIWSPRIIYANDPKWDGEAFRDNITHAKDVQAQSRRALRRWLGVPE